MTKLNSITINEETLNKMFPIQEELELSSRQKGLDKVRKYNAELAKNGGEASTEYGHQMLVHGLDKFAEGIREWFQEDTSRGGHEVKILNMVKSGSPETIAYLFMKGVINSISNKDVKLTNALTGIVTTIEDEFMLKDLRLQNKALTQRLVDSANKRTGYRKMQVIKKAMNDEAANNTIEAWPKWEGNIKLRLGEKLLNIMMQTIGLVKITKEKMWSGKKVKDVKRLVATEETLQWLEERGDKAGLNSPSYKPLVIPPRDWTYENLENGIYYTYNCRPVKFVKTQAKNYFQELRNSDIDVVLHAVNAMQKTAWSINKPMLSLVKELWDAQVTWCPSIPRRTAEAKPEYRDITELTVQEKAIYWGEIHRVEVSNREDKSKRAAFSALLELADEYKDFDAWYLGYNLDFRGRIYSVSGFLNGMGPDEAKAVMQFAKGKRLGESGARYLAIHLANLGDIGGVSKKPLQARVDWCYSNEALIRAVAANPWDNRVWVEADAPFQFVAACMDWVGYLENGVDHISHTVCALDGSCSGLQHLSMAMRCTTTARDVNILPSDEPKDLYQIVADKVIEALRADSVKPFEHWGEPRLNNMGKRVPNYTELALEWLKVGFTRKAAKSSCMTYSYGSKKYGFREQIIKDFMKPLLEDCKKTGVEFPFSYDNGFRAASYIANLLWEAVVSSVERPAAMMKWLQDSSSIVAKSEFELLDGTKQTLPVRWETPLGFPVVQSYYNTKKHQVRTYLEGSIVYLTLQKKLDKIDSKKSAQSMSPNWVHSLDAAHLQLSVSRMTEKTEGQASFSMVHDSFGCHAADLQLFSNQIKFSLVELYETNDVVDSLYEQLLPQLNADDKDLLTLPPERGELEYGLVPLSLYAFS